MRWDARRAKLARLLALHPLSALRPTRPSRGRGGAVTSLDPEHILPEAPPSRSVSFRIVNADSHLAHLEAVLTSPTVPASRVNIDLLEVLSRALDGRYAVERELGRGGM